MSDPPRPVNLFDHDQTEMREMLKRAGLMPGVEGALDEETREHYRRLEEYAYRMRQQHHPGAAPGEFVGTPEDLEAIMKLVKDFGKIQAHVLERERHESARFTGCHVTLKNLEGAKELNGRVGKCVRWIEDRSRMEVKLLDDDGAVTQTVCVKMEKMELIIDEASLSGCAACGAKTSATGGKLDFVRVTRSDTATRTVRKSTGKRTSPNTRSTWNSCASWTYPRRLKRQRSSEHSRPP